MNKNEKDVIEILKEAMSGQPACLSENPDWKSIYIEMRNHGVASIAYDVYKNHSGAAFDDELDKEWSKTVLSQINGWYFMMEKQQELVDLLSEAGFEFAIMKGAANAVLYPVPELRKSGDIDFLVKWDKYERIQEFLIQNGYSLKEDQEKDKHHIVLKKETITFELHKNPGGTKTVREKKHRDLVVSFQKALDHVSYAEWGEYSFPVLPEPLNGVMLLVHIAGHMRTGIGLRHLVDWMVYAEKYLSDQYWEECFGKAAEEGHVYELAKILTRICQRCLGLNKDLTWCRDADPNSCKQLLEFLVEQGDFGAKANNDRGTKVLTEMSSFRSGVEKIYQSSLYSMPAARDHCILRPIALIYQVCRYVYFGLKQKNAVQALIKSKKRGDMRSELFAKLKV